MGTKVTTLACGLSNLQSKQIKFIWMFYLFQKKITYKNHVFLSSLAFSINLLVCEFYSHRQNIVPKIYKDLSTFEEPMG